MTGKFDQRFHIRIPSRCEEESKEREQEHLLRSLRQHGQVLESSDPDAEPGPGQTHVYVKPSESGPGVLIEKRKSFFKR